MGSKSTFFKFFVVVILIVLLVFQILSMKQSDRLFERINILEKNMSNIYVEKMDINILK